MNNYMLVMKKYSRKIIEKSFGSWKTKGSGVEFVRKIRDESEKRFKRMKL